MRKKIKDLAANDVCYRIYDSGLWAKYICVENNFLCRKFGFDYNRLILNSQHDTIFNFEELSESEYIADTIGYIFFSKDDAIKHLTDQIQTIKETLEAITAD